MSYSVQTVRGDFPNLRVQVRGEELVYLDNAATTFKPKMVIERVREYYENEVANVHRGAHFLSSQGTERFEAAREAVARFIGAQQPSEIVFTKGTTDSFNLLAHSLVSTHLKPGDEIILSELEHHSNIVPWQLAAAQYGCKIKVIPINERGELDLTAFENLLTPKSKVLSITLCSNTLGNFVPVAEFIRAARLNKMFVALDAAQAVACAPIDVKSLDCDFLAFSGHKIFAPFGVGILYGRQKVLESLLPYQGGGSMISEVTFEKTTYAAVPQRFEAGTPSVGDALGLHAALDYVSALGFANIQKHEQKLVAYAREKMSTIEGLRILGPGESVSHAPILSFEIAGAHPSDIGQILDQKGIAIRTGHLCTQPLLRKLGLTATARASFSIYNTEDEVDKLVAGIKKAKELLNG